MRKGTIFLIAATLLLVTGQRERTDAQGAHLETPIVFVTQVPVPTDSRDLLKIGATFGNHSPDAGSAGRGGDLWIRYPDGSLKNLTAAAGYGTGTVQQGLTSIAVRDPSVHWDGTTVIFSMVVGMDTGGGWGLGNTSFWQLYEVTGLGQDDTPRIYKVPGQPDRYNNLTPVYTSDDRIVFTSDRPRNGARHLYPQHDEYDIRPIVSGVWLLDPATGGLRILAHSPSGAFTPIIDSFGRVIFTQWDHLQRDQHADFDILDCGDNNWSVGVTNWSDESAESVPLDDSTEVFPEPRECRTDLLAGTAMRGHHMSHFFPWQMRQDGHELETLNHIGRHEVLDWFAEGRTDDANVVEYWIGNDAGRSNGNVLRDMFHIREDPTRPGHYMGTQATHFGTQSGGQIVSLDGRPDLNAERMNVTYITHPDAAEPTEDGESAGSDHSGLYRDPMRTTNGTYIAVHTPETRTDVNEGSNEYPLSRYDYRIKTLERGADGYYEAATPLTGGISKHVRYVGGPVWDRAIIEYEGDLWELQPVELVPRPRPPLDPPLFGNEDGYPIVRSAGFDPQSLRQFLIDNDLALMASRNVTIRDDADTQQPFNLRIPGGTETIAREGHVYDVSYLQIFQADQLRSLTSTNDDGVTSPFEGRRVLAQPLHAAAAMAANPPAPRGAPPGSVTIAYDGSAAAFVPASRALAWQLLAPDGTPVVRERYWLTFQPGEIRVCGSCHGVNELDQKGRLKENGRTDIPVALADLLAQWRGR